MARAKLHLICGNCGCNDMWEWDHKKGDEDAPEDVYLHCRNCATLHSLNDKAQNLNEPPVKA